MPKIPYQVIAPTEFEPSVAYIYQGTHNLELTAALLSIRDGHINHFTLRGGVDIFKHHVWYLAPLASIAYFRHIYIPVTKTAGWMAGFSVSYWRKKILGEVNAAICPEVLVGFYSLSFAYGYNFPIATLNDAIFNRHRFSIRFGF